jgi:hypothetical protein
MRVLSGVCLLVGQIFSSCSVLLGYDN